MRSSERVKETLREPTNRKTKTMNNQITSQIDKEAMLNNLVSHVHQVLPYQLQLSSNWKEEVDQLYTLAKCLGGNVRLMVKHRAFPHLPHQMVTPEDYYSRPQALRPEYAYVCERLLPVLESAGLNKWESPLWKD